MITTCLTDEDRFALVCTGSLPCTGEDIAIMHRNFERFQRWKRDAKTRGVNPEFWSSVSNLSRFVNDYRHKMDHKLSPKEITEVCDRVLKAERTSQVEN